jgi:hypothetical protein
MSAMLRAGVGTMSAMSYLAVGQTDMFITWV